MKKFEQLKRLYGTITGYMKPYDFSDTMISGLTADFDRLFTGLKEINYKHSFILQAARGADNKEEENISEQRKFVTGYIERYGI